MVLILMLVSLLLVSAPSMLGQSGNDETTIRVQVRHSQTHRLLKGHWIQLTTMEAQYRILVGRTGPDGVVTFDLKHPVPAEVDVVDLSGYPCTSPEVFQTREILERGVVGAYDFGGNEKADKWCTPNPNAPQAENRPGEIVFYAHPLNAWQRFWADW